MTGSHIGGGAAWGALGGGLIGLLDAWVARGATLDPEPSVWLVAVLVDGAIGALVGALLGALLRRDLPAVGPVAAVVVGLVAATGIRAAMAPDARPGGDPPARAVVWIAPSPWAAETAEVGERADVLAGGAAVFERLVVDAADPDDAFATALAGRWPEGRRDGGPSLARDVTRQGGVAALVARDEPGGVEPGDAFERVAWVRGAAPLGLGPAGRHLLLPSLLGRPAPAGPEAWVAALDEALRGSEDDVVVVVVRLDATDLATVDQAVAALVSRARERVDEVSLVVGGLVGAAPDGAPALGPEATTAPLVVLSSDGGGAGVRVTDQVRSVDLAPTLLDLAGLQVVDAWDGFSLVPRIGLAVQLARAAVPPVEIGDDDVVVRLDDTPVTCDTEHLDARDLVARTLGSDGTEVVRRGGYALVLDGEARALFDEVEDPRWERDLLAERGATLCDGTPADEAADALDAAARAVVDQSRTGRERSLPDDEAGAVDREFPDPLAPLPEAG